MTAPVDVLAVYDRLLREVPMGAGHMRNITEARAAIAELIEAAEWADRMIAQHARNEDGQTLDTSPLRAALARVGSAGGAA